MKPADVCKMYNCSKTELYYWESIGLLKIVTRTNRDYREYANEDLVVINIIKAMTYAKFTRPQLRAEIEYYHKNGQLSEHSIKKLGEFKNKIDGYFSLILGF